MNLSKPKLIAIGIVAFIVIILVLMFTGIIPGLKPPPANQQHAELTVWGIKEFDDGTIIPAIAGKTFTIHYQEFPLATYETDLVNALAAGRGPDVFMVHNTWLPKHADKMAPLVSSQFTITNLRTLFPTVVEQDFAPDNGVIYALPLYIDTLALLYNKDIFDTAEIALPPTTWTEFEGLIPRLRQLDAQGGIVRAAAAIGGSAKTVNRATDLLNALMLQAGVQMVNSNFTSATFASDGLDPLLFYTKFANAANPAFTWNDRFTYSIDSFAEESTAMIFNYSYQSANLKEKFPFLKVGVAPLPQPVGADRKVTFANYWGFAAAKTGLHQADAWDLILALTTNEAGAAKYLDATHRPPALRTLIQQHLNDPELGVFASQALYARSWPQIDNNFVETTFSQMIEDVLRGFSGRDAIQKAESAITQKMQSQSL